MVFICKKIKINNNYFFIFLIADFFGRLFPGGENSGNTPFGGQLEGSHRRFFLEEINHS